MNYGTVYKRFLYTTIIVHKGQRLFANMPAWIVAFLETKGRWTKFWMICRHHSKDLPNFEMVYFRIYKYKFIFKTCMLLITLCSTTFVCEVFYFAHLIAWHSKIFFIYMREKKYHWMHKGEVDVQILRLWVIQGEMKLR
jgi:hypothetical protein